jgi:hypothetical protein
MVRKFTLTTDPDMDSDPKTLELTRMAQLCCTDFAILCPVNTDPHPARH